MLLGVRAAAEDDLAARPSHHDATGEHDHDDFDTFVVTVPTAHDPDALIDRLSEATRAHDILRIKGFIEVAGKPMRLLVQGVGQRFRRDFDRPWSAGEERREPPRRHRPEGRRPRCGRRGALRMKGEAMDRMTLSGCERHREERSDEAIQLRAVAPGLLRFARNDGDRLPPSAPAPAP